MSAGPRGCVSSEAAETGRGSPVGMDFYDHVVFPERYRGALFLGDWAIGVIYAVHLKRDGASYKADVERFCTGAPMNVTDLVVGPDGHLVLARRIDSPRFRRVETYSPRNVLHAFRLTSPMEVDAEFGAFLAEAYRVGAQEERRRGVRHRGPDR